MRSVALFSTSLLFLFSGLASANPPSPYVGQETRAIKALSAQEVQDYLEGKGMGLAKAAELNRYPGPAHALELAVPLDLTIEQKARTQELFKRMQEKAITLGRLLVDEEVNLDRLFATRTVTPETLRAALERIGKVQSQVREAHLEAHLAQTEILSPAQTAKYVELRGYGAHPTGNGERQHGRH
ncbi:MAG: periplasmic heavy metal sensor [Betaproteobacteria bacterium]|nr:MAG: periplasmic heavy metal sensor [Betaproteobacteria bacterium]